MNARFQRSFLRPIFALAIPVAVAAQVDNLTGVAEILMVGQLGAEAVSAVGVSRMVIFVLAIAMLSISTGSFTMVAQLTGAGDTRRTSEVVKQSITLVALVSVGLGVFGALIAPAVLRSLSVAPDVVATGTPYLRVIFLGMTPMTLNFTIANCFYGAGEARLPLYLGLFGTAVKIAAMYALIFGAGPVPALGVNGAAYGSILGASAAFLLGMGCLYSGRFALRLTPDTSYLPERDLARRMLRIGVPSALQGLFRNGSGLVFVKLVALTSASTAAVAAFSIGSQMERILRRTSLAFGTAATTLVGQSLGAQRPDEAEAAGWTTIAVSVVAMLLLVAPVAFLGEYLMGLFTEEAEVIAIGVAYFYAMALAEPFQCLGIAAGGGLRGAGDTRPPLYHTLIAQWLIRLPVGYVLAFELGYDIDGLWAALVIFAALQGALTVTKYARGEWKDRRI